MKKPPHELLYVAAETNDCDKLKELLERGVDASFVDEGSGQTTLHRAARHTNALKLLLENTNLDLTVKARDGRTPLMIAAYWGNNSGVSMLLEKSGVDQVCAVDSSFSTALHYAAERGNASTVRLLLEANESAKDTVDGGRNTPSHKAAIGGHVDTIKALLDFEADVEIRNCDGMTAKECAAWMADGDDSKCFQDCVKLLQERES